MKNILNVTKITTVNGVVHVRVKGIQPAFMPEQFKQVLQRAGLSSTIHFSAGQTAGVPEGYFDVLTSPNGTAEDCKMLFPFQLNAALAEAGLRHRDA